MDNEPETIADDTLEDFDDLDLEVGNQIEEFDEAEGGETDDDEQPDEATEDEAEEGQTDEDADDDSEDQTLVALDDGTEVAVDELKAGYLRNRDYTHKTTEVAEERRAVQTEREALTQRQQFVNHTVQNLTNFIQGLIPPEPPVSLAQTDPSAYTAQKALRDQALAEVGQITQVQANFQNAQEQFSQEDMAEYRRKEDAKLVKAMPHLSDPAKRQAFNEDVKKAAMEFGFSEDEIGATGDHRILQLVHYAGLGKRAAQNRANAQRRAAKPAKGKPTKAAAKGAPSQNRQAMDRLLKTGSIEDAMSIDIDF